MALSPHHVARPTPAWQGVAHRFPPPPVDDPAIPEIDAASANRVHTHIVQSLMQMFDGLDVATKNLHLSPAGRAAQTNEVGQQATRHLNEFLQPSTLAGLSLASLTAHASETEARAARSIQPDPARLPLLVALMNRLADADRPARVRIVSVAIATLQNDPSDQDAIATLQGALIAPDWVLDLPEGMEDEAVTALRLALAGQTHAQSLALSALVDHSQRLIENAHSSLRQAGVVTSLAEAA